MSESEVPAPLARINFSGKIHLLNDNHSLKVLADLLSATQLGFDTETKPAFKKGEVNKVALLQLATETDAYIIRLHRISDFNLIKQIFENQNISKIGVAIRDDLKHLQKIFKFDPKSFIELQDIAKKKNLKNFGLKGMTEEVLNAALSKGAKLTNWESPQLTPPQLLYAATDAWIGLKIYQKLMDVTPVH